MLSALTSNLVHSRPQVPDNQQILSTLVLDAGHGGKDPGAVSADGRTFEKNIALDIARRLSKSIHDSIPEVKVVLTRADDTYPTLSQRAAACNRCNADLFLSIHINSAKRTSARGFSTHILGESDKRDLYALNMEICKRENSVVCDYENYDPQSEGFDPRNPEASSIIFSLMQNAYLEQSMLFADDMNKCLARTPLAPGFGTLQAPFQLLWQTSCPSVLVECGFISNTEDLEYLRSEKGRQEIADALFAAFKVYKARYDISVSGSITTGGTVAEGPARVDENTVKYGIQIASSSKMIPLNDPYFKGLPVEVHNAGAVHKYIVYPTDTYEKLITSHSSDVKKLFPDSFVVKITSKGISYYKKLSTIQ
ncbi:MAG: N-acetylmuramoyl-L-alanine amidase [Bacteroidales bacterium]|nr:N-acetylmuramoyl-L-alanine amidase [Bacteroidales bacterium]